MVARYVYLFFATALLLSGVTGVLVAEYVHLLEGLLQLPQSRVPVIRLLGIILTVEGIVALWFWNAVLRKKSSRD